MLLKVFRKHFEASIADFCSVEDEDELFKVFEDGDFGEYNPEILGLQFGAVL